MGTIEHVSVHYRRLRRQVSRPRWSVQGRVGRSHFGGCGLGGRSLSRLPRRSGSRRHAPYNRTDQVEPGFRFSGRQPEPGGWLARLTTRFHRMAALSGRLRGRTRGLVHFRRARRARRLFRDAIASRVFRSSVVRLCTRLPDRLQCPQPAAAGRSNEP